MIINVCGDKNFWLMVNIFGSVISSLVDQNLSKRLDLLF